MPGTTPIITPLTPADLPGIWVIEQTLVGPWTQGQLATELTLGRGWQLVAKETHGPILGYIFGSTVIDEAEIRKLAVSQVHRRRGIAQLLLDAACRYLSRLSVTSCYLELRASNLPALSLYQKNGFHVIGQRQGYYTLPAEDAIVLKKSIGQCP